jgi:hypothetical protein
MSAVDAQTIHNFKNRLIYYRSTIYHNKSNKIKIKHEITTQNSYPTKKKDKTKIHICTTTGQKENKKTSQQINNNKAHAYTPINLTHTQNKKIKTTTN